MARPLTPSSARLGKLERARDRVMRMPRGEVLGAKVMSQVLGVSWPTLRDWCGDIAGFEDSGAFERGGNGIDYQFCPVRTLWFLVEHYRAMVAAESADADRLTRINLGDAAAAVPSGTSLDDLRKQLDLQTRFQDLKERDGRRVDADQIRTALTQCFSAMQQAGVLTAQELDPTGQWPPDVRAIVEEACRAMLLKQQRAALECLKPLRQGNSANGSEDLRNAARPAGKQRRKRAAVGAVER